ncbi:LysR family transcriptional regulator [Alteromonas sp. P256]|uniref:LysR family transcriptional regulator n=1 Tax=Alteromonas sp. P256 TaxID=3117399 RepID=UPI002FE16BF0
MHKMNFNALDLNLLRVFDAVMKTRNVSKAADSLYMSQPAVSHALGRLRHALKDDLFIKNPGGMKPTSRAIDIAPAIHRSLHELSDALSPATFDPASSTHTLRIATHDYFVSVLMPQVAHFLSLHAPGISLQLRLMEGRALDMLDEQEIDLAISAFGPLPSRFDARLLVKDSYVCLMRGGHPLNQYTTLTLERYAKARHMLVSPRGDSKGFIDDVLADYGLTRHVAVVINQFAAAGQILIDSDLILTAPKHIAKQICRHHDITTKTLPFDLRTNYAKTQAVWHNKLGTSPALNWFIEVLTELAKPLQAS